MRNYLCVVPFMMLLVVSVLGADDNDDPALVRRIPPPGVPLKPEARAELEKAAEGLNAEILSLRDDLKDKPQLLELLPDIQIYYNAVHYAVIYNEFYNAKDPAKDLALAKKLLQQGSERAQEIRVGKTPWTTQTGAIVRGYVSKIDGSVQPYGLVVPASFDPKADHPWRLDFWYHGRGENLTEMSFIQDRQGSLGAFAPKDAFVLHPYGRYCNANKFAGEVDTFEALENAKKHYKIDDNRVSVRGFSMGGASTWQYAVHFPGLWACAAPGAGFAETPEFTHAFDPKNKDPKPTEYEQKLWNIYDSTHYAENLFNLPVIAYSGELDGQKQAADIMAKTMKEYGLELKQVIGPGTKHAYEPKAKEEVAKLVDEIVEKGRNPVPKHIKFTTFTLRYNQDFWITLDGLGEHWKKARIEAEINGDAIKATTENITALSFDFAPGLAPFSAAVQVTLDGQTIGGPAPAANKSWSMRFKRDGDKWSATEAGKNIADGLVKKHGLQGPIDDAFMDSFIFVTHSDAALHGKTGEWVKNETLHAMEHWRRTYRGEARVVSDDRVTDEMIKNSNLVLWGDPSSNRIIAKIIDKLPIKWTKETLEVGGHSFPSQQHMLLMVFPNPLNPSRYVVLNSSFTFRENEYLNNAKQNAKLPDWAIIDVSSPPTSRWPGRVVAEDFFDEHWAVKK